MMKTEWCGDHPEHKPHKWSKDRGLNYVYCYGWYGGGHVEEEPTHNKVQIVVSYFDHQTRYFVVDDCWRIDSAHRCIVIGKFPREYIPLDNVVNFTVESIPG